MVLLPAPGPRVSCLGDRRPFSDEAFWATFWLLSVIWNGQDGHGGISHWLG
ncbi:hypothetical protein [Streptomyces sp. NPDC018045]|uniref:hypothetical protein n=1 Tax=Streptomyces sp. NPDC018045 TaxID=3365037 RepID=UPI0037A9C107